MAVVKGERLLSVRLQLDERRRRAGVGREENRGRSTGPGKTQSTLTGLSQLDFTELKYSVLSRGYVEAVAVFFGDCSLKYGSYRICTTTTSIVANYLKLSTTLVLSGLRWESHRVMC